jgi:hypothetical protein
VLLRLLWRLACWLWRIALQIGAWLLPQLLVPALCFGCVYAGALLTLILPASLLVEMWPTALPLAELLDLANLEEAPLTALPLAVVVFRRAYLEWQTCQDPLGARMLYACAAGVAWPKAWFRFRRPLQGSGS